MDLGTCKVCGGWTRLLLFYGKQPAAHTLDISSEKDLEIHQCMMCGLVQVQGDPVSYHRVAMRSDSPGRKEAREYQLKAFIEEFNIDPITLVEIDTDPPRFPDGIASAFVMYNYLEHVPHPNEMLSEINGRLVGQGVGIIEVPNFDMIIKESLFLEFTRDHLFYFTKDTLRTTLELNGFQILKLETLHNDYVISAIVQKRKHVSNSEFQAKAGRLRKALRDFINKHGEVAIWGASHQTLMLLSLYDFTSNDILYVVDSALSKQGKTTSRGIRIAGPQLLDEMPVKAIIVCAGGYNEEILKALEKYNVKKAVIEKGVLVECLV